MTTQLPDQLIVLMHGTPLAMLRRGRRNARLTLEYLPDLPTGTTPLSVSMPLAGSTHTGPVVTNWIRGLLPDRSDVLRAWRRTFAVTSLEEYALLEHVGRDVAGAAQFARPDQVDDVTAHAGLRPLTDSQIAERLRGMTSDAQGWGVDAHSGQFSLAGAQAKFALHHGPAGWAVPTGSVPTTHILKPSIPAMVDQDINEHLTMRTAALVGLRVPATDVVAFDGQRALVVERYDRTRLGGELRRVHQEDMCQALGVSPDGKYETDGGPRALDVVALLRDVVTPADQAADTMAFVTALGFNWLVAGTDAHAKNFALLLDGPQARLAPLYDLNSYLPYAAGRPAHLSMSLGPGRHTIPERVTRGDWEWLARRAGLNANQVIDVLHGMAAALPDAAATAATGVRAPIAGAFVDAVAQHTKTCATALYSAPPRTSPEGKARTS